MKKMSDGKIVYNFNCPITHCSNSANSESNLDSEIKICKQIQVKRLSNGLTSSKL